MLRGRRSAGPIVAVSVSDPTPDLEIDFSSYANTAALIADKGAQGSFAFENDDTQPGQIVLDTAKGYGNSTKSMRYDYVGGVQCGSYTIRRNLWLGTGKTEVWVEAYLAFSSSWETYPSYMAATCEPDYNPDFKLLFGRMSGTIPNPDPGRFEVLWGNSINSNIVGGYPGNEARYQAGNGSLVTSRRNAQFFRLRVHWKYVAGNGGICQTWVDDTRVISDENVTAGPGVPGMSADGGTINSLAICANRDPRPGTDQSMWWGRVRAWYVGNAPSWT